VTDCFKWGVRPQRLACCAEYCQRQSPARLHRAPHVLKGGHWIAKEHDSKAREPQLEAVGCERMDRSVGDDGLRVPQTGKSQSIRAPGRPMARRHLRQAHDHLDRRASPAQELSCRRRNQYRARAHPAGAPPNPTTPSLERRPHDPFAHIGRPTGPAWRRGSKFDLRRIPCRSPIVCHRGPLGVIEVNKPYFGAAAQGGSGASASTPMTVQDVLRHTAGMVNPGIQRVTPVRQRYIDAGINDQDQSLAERVDKLARMPLAHHPGTAWDYSHGVDVTGRLIGGDSGMSLDRFVAQNVTGPLDMVDTGLSRARRQLAPHRTADGRPGDWQVACPARREDTRQNWSVANGGMVGTRRDYLRFSQMLLNGGVLNDVRILGAGKVAHMTSDHLGPISRNTETARWLLGPGFGFGLGFAVRLAAGESPMAGSAGDYWWGGAFRTLFVVDPLQELVAV